MLWEKQSWQVELSTILFLSFRNLSVKTLTQHVSFLRNLKVSFFSFLLSRLVMNDLSLNNCVDEGNSPWKYSNTQKYSRPPMSMYFTIKHSNFEISNCSDWSFYEFVIVMESVWVCTVLLSVLGWNICFSKKKEE